MLWVAGPVAVFWIVRTNDRFSRYRQARIFGFVCADSFSLAPAMQRELPQVEF